MHRTAHSLEWGALCTLVAKKEAPAPFWTTSFTFVKEWFAAIAAQSFHVTIAAEL